MKNVFASLALLGLLAACQTPGGAWRSYNDAENKCRHDAYDVLTPQEMHSNLREHPEIEAKYQRAKAQCLAPFEAQHPQLTATAKNYIEWLRAHPPLLPDGEAIVTDQSGNYIGWTEYYGGSSITTWR